MPLYDIIMAYGNTPQKLKGLLFENLNNTIQRRLIYMQNIDINITSNVQNHTWSGVASHVDRDYKKDRNKGINPKYTKYNLMLSKQDLNPVIEKHFQKLVAKHDAKYRGTKHANRMYGSVHNYLAKRRGKPESTVVLKIGSRNNKQDEDDKKRLVHAVYVSFPMTKQEAIVKVKEANDKAFKLYTKGYMSRHPLGKSAIPMGHAETNEDEAGMDHIHYNIADLGFTKKGNASMGFSYAVMREYHTSNRHKAMKIWHNQEDPAMLDCMNEVYRQYGIHFNLQRTGHAYHLGQAVYKGAEAEKDKQFQRLDASVRSLIKQNSKLKRQKNQVDQSANSDKIISLKAQNKSLSTINQSLASKNISLQHLINVDFKKLKTTNSHLSQRLSDNQTKLKNNQEKLADLEKLYHQLKQKYKKLENEFSNSSRE